MYICDCLVQYISETLKENVVIKLSDKMCSPQLTLGQRGGLWTKPSPDTHMWDV